MKFTIDAIRRSLERMVRPIDARYWRKAYEQEKKERLRMADRKWWYQHRFEMLAENQKRMRDPERTLVCDILANGQLLPDPEGSRYGPNDPSSPTADAKPQSAATALSAVGCSGLLGDDYGRTLDLIECFSSLSPKKGKRLLDRLKSNKISPIEASNEALKLSLRLLFKDDLLGVSES